MKKPAYREVYQTLKGQIREKKYPVGSMLPTETELQRQFSVSRTTIRRAIGILVAEGYIKVTQGHGTEVVDVSAVQKLNHLTSITETLSQKGCRITTPKMDIRKVPADASVAEALQIPKGESVYHIQRLQYADDMPIAIMVNYLKIGRTPDLETHVGTFSGLYAFLERQYGIVMSEATEYLSAVAATLPEAQLLNVEIGEPLLCSRRISRVHEEPFEYSINKLVADKYEYCVYLHRRKST